MTEPTFTKLFRDRVEGSNNYLQWQEIESEDANKFKYLRFVCRNRAGEEFLVIVPHWLRASAKEQP